MSVFVRLERLAGTEHYARQVSALLDETVESPNFVVSYSTGSGDAGQDGLFLQILSVG